MESDMPVQNVLVLGASGGTGRQVVSQALRRGDQVTAFVRDPARLPMTHERLRTVTGSVTSDDSALASAMQGQDAVICALGAGKSFKSGNVIADSVTHIVRAMNTTGVRRLIMMSAFGVGHTDSDVPLIPRTFGRLLLKDIYQDKAAGEEQIHRSGLEWTVVYPTALFDGPETGRVRAGEHLALSGFPRISRADVAAFLLGQVGDVQYLRKGVLISS